MNPDISNTIFQKAVSFVMHTNRNLFVTGKAGTGKTTFLKYIKEKAYRKMAIVAPTGVAAINAGGVTIHSFFQLPFGPFIPTTHHTWGSYSGEMNNPLTLINNQQISREKFAIIRELEVLVIDEVSMVRADLLDSIDTVLRHVKDQPNRPFGGVQMIFIGDLFQLPPVVKNNEWDLLKKFYTSPFFFDAHVLKNNEPLYIELKKIYRQKDDRFIALLNNVRNNCCTDSDLELLHQYYKPGFTASSDKHFITLSSHNEKADKINQRELERLPGKLWTFEATIEGSFFENSYPADKTLFLKEGAQIMFIKNDIGENRRYFNGKIGAIKSITTEKIVIAFPGETNELELDRETWQNIKYSYNKESDRLDEDKLGSFSQYPIRLAWAITIHKSQGLTFERAIIDAGASFAAGQVYVSLSRLTSLDGLVLYSKILPGCISTDPRVVAFTKKEVHEDELQQTLEMEERNFIRYSLLEHFDFGKLIKQLKDHHADYEFRQLDKKELAISWSQSLIDALEEERLVAKKFQSQLHQLISQSDGKDYTHLYARIKAGIAYFKKQLEEKIISSIKNHLENIRGQAKVKTYSNAIKELIRVFQRKKLSLEHTAAIADALQNNAGTKDLLALLEGQRKPIYVPHEPDSPPPGKYKKPVKGSSSKETLRQFRLGKSIKDIAHERFLATETIFNHLAGFLKTGEVEIQQLVPEEKLEKILHVIDESPNQLSSFYKERLDEEIRYEEIRAVMSLGQVIK